MKILRQGDVLLVQVNSMPSSKKAVPLESGRVVLAHGEVTGHSHAITVVKEMPTAKLWSAGAERFLQVLARSELRHEEHSTVVLDPGIYRVAIQTEYTPQEIRRVAD